MENHVFYVFHIRGMENNFHFFDSAGNWIAFLFGVTFNIVTHVIESGPASYFIHAVAGGIICLLFKMLGDLFTPLIHRFGHRLTRWIDGIMADPYDSGKKQ